MPSLEKLKIKIFADGADEKGMLEMAGKSYVKGLTTNPSLMKKAGITDYPTFCKKMSKLIPQLPLSFEIFADEFDEMYTQAELIKTWGKNVYVKIPVMNTKKQYSYELIEKLAKDGVQLNITAIFTLDQVKHVCESMKTAKTGFISVFAGRAADTGANPIELMKASLKIIKDINPKLELLWASTRETYNIFEADAIGCDIITVPNSILNNLHLVGKDLEEYSLDTVKSFYKDAMSAGFSL